MQSSLREAFQTYGLTADSPEEAVSTLRVSAAQYAELTRQKDRASKDRQVLAQHVQQLEKALLSFCSRYDPQVTPDALENCLQKILQDSLQYRNASAGIAEKEQQTALQNQELEELSASFAAFLQKYHLSFRLGDRAALQNLRASAAEIARLKTQLQRDTSEKGQFCREHPDISGTPENSSVRSMDSLKAAEKNLSGEIGNLSSRLLKYQQKIRMLQAEADSIPKLRSELKDWEAARDSSIRSAKLADQTIHFLEEAKASLSNRYLGGIQNRFAHYVSVLAKEDRETVSVSPELEIQADRLGAAREMACFSAGQTDLLLLCMRLALVDTLFPEEKPCLILDDPFVNLDDRHTARALALLKALGKEHQILYLVCNSSRTVN